MNSSADFDRFYRETAPRVLRYAHALTADLAEAQDVTQEAFVRAWQRWGRICQYDNAESWVRLVVTRLATDGWRKRRSLAPALRLARPPAQVKPPSEDTVLLVTALRTLPPAQRQVVALHYLCDMSIADIAVELGAKAGTVKAWLSRGRSALAAQLGDAVTEASNAE